MNDDWGICGGNALMNGGGWRQVAGTLAILVVLSLAVQASILVGILQPNLLQRLLNLMQ
jgi:hypothetical protein